MFCSVREVSRKIGEAALAKVAAEVKAEALWKEELLQKTKPEGAKPKRGHKKSSSASSSGRSDSIRDSTVERMSLPLFLQIMLIG